MGKKAVRILVGLMGGSLYRTNPLPTEGRRFWVNVPELMISGYAPMMLGRDGVLADPTWGEEMQAGGPDDKMLSGYYSDALNALKNDAPDSSWDVDYEVYDWRKSHTPQGKAVASDIVDMVEQGGYESVTLACHSQGGIIARVAWLTLLAQNKQQYIRRIVTVGTPHFGAWPVFASILGYSQQVRQLAFVANAFLPQSLPFGKTIAQYIAIIAGTFPSFYELFPQINAPSAAYDKQKTLPYFGRFYPLWQTSGQWTEQAEAFQNTINAQGNIPDPQTMFCFYGQAVSTKYGVVQRNDGSFFPAYSNVGDGDGTVLKEDQFFADHDSDFFSGVAHSDLMGHAGRSGKLSWAVYQWQHASPSKPPPDAAGLKPTKVPEGPFFCLPFDTIDGGASVTPPASPIFPRDP